MMIEEARLILEKVPQERRSVARWIDNEDRVCPVVALASAKGQSGATAAEQLLAVENEWATLRRKQSCSTWDSQEWWELDEAIDEVLIERCKLINLLTSRVAMEFGLNPNLIVSDTDTYGWSWVINHLNNYVLFEGQWEVPFKEDYQELE